MRAAALAFALLLALAAPALAARGVASATIVVPASLASPPSSETAAVAITTVQEGAYERVTIAFN